jgi:hypothetical protein
MINHLELSDDAFENLFLTCQLNPDLFTHEAHLRLAWIHITKYGEAQAIENITNQLLNFVTRLGAADKYNTTVTIAAIKAVHHFTQKSQSATFTDFIQEFPKLKYNFKELLRTHYGVDIFKVERAKQEFLEPDLLPFT